jgi:hypothetical protein
MTKDSTRRAVVADTYAGGRRAEGAEEEVKKANCQKSWLQVRLKHTVFICHRMFNGACKLIKFILAAKDIKQ